MRFFIRRIKRDDIGLEAASLAFTSILGLIPALAVILAIFTLVPSFQDVKEALSNFVSQNFMPVFSDSVNAYVGRLVSQAGRMTVAGTVALFVVALLLVRTIDRSLNRIWRGGRRKIGHMVAIYWTLLTLGPLAAGLIIWITYKVLAYAITSGGGVGISLMVVYFIFPIVIEIVMVTAVFMIVPVAQVRFQDALLGAVVVTVSFELSKKIFSVFVLHFSNYEAIYGAMATLPVFMIWIYINWWIVLIGAEFTATLGIVRAGNTDEVPNFMVYLANITGTTLGNDRITQSNKKSLINIKISKKAGS